MLRRNFGPATEGYRLKSSPWRTNRSRCFAPTRVTLRFSSSEVGEYSSVRVGLHYRALGIDVKDGISWFWVGTHAEYDKLVG